MRWAGSTAHIAAFAALPFDVSPLDEGRTTLVASDDDPFNPEGAENSFGRPLSLPTIILPGQGHFTPDSGYGDWPSLLDWCLDPHRTGTISPR